jgi:hypothetical protein
MVTCHHTGDFARWYKSCEMEQPCPHAYYCPVCRYYSGCDRCDPLNQRYSKRPVKMTEGLRAVLEGIIAEKLERKD